MLEIIEEILKIFAKNGLFDEGVELIKVRVPNPANYFFHKLIVSARRRNLAKSGKDLEQAICTSTIVDAEAMANRFKKFPKGWQTDILKVLARAEKNLPLYSQEIERINLTLQSAVKS